MHDLIAMYLITWIYSEHISYSAVSYMHSKRYDITCHQNDNCQKIVFKNRQLIFVIRPNNAVFLLPSLELFENKTENSKKKPRDFEKLKTWYLYLDNKWIGMT